MVVISNSKAIPVGLTYHPDRENWHTRTAQRLAEDPSLPTATLPYGFPSKLDSPLVWEGKDWTDEQQWVYNLSEADLKEIDSAVKHFHGLKLHLGHVSKDTFPLPTLASTLHSLSAELHSGRGFFVLRTLPVDEYSREDIVLIYVGVSSYIAPVRGLQDANGGVLSHIKDLSATQPKGAIGGPAYTTDKQVFHTDQGADIVSLFALETAAEGGISRISSSWRVYNELAEKRPDLVRTLAEPWPFDEFGRNPPCTLRPLLYFTDSKAILQYARRYFTGFLALPRSNDIPPITEAQAEALDTLHFLGEKFSLGLNFQKGDIQYINNLAIFHARDGFRDEGAKTRHLLRLWLRNEELAWTLPNELKPLWKNTFNVSPEEQTFALEPVIRDAVKGRS
ncbi:taurine catabolism dioxygenase TauD [Crucibulum laeve]|uniref:Taurine catabolism dioxygenase TauD n=1 Tax=Crucibulum laeve TaxID=68775 RepID=A0A5C3LH37_9AGAR|nr:taurine catabolism dioxygenase TauD [Crucibulum laeve]